MTKVEFSSNYSADWKTHNCKNSDFLTNNGRNSSDSFDILRRYSFDLSQGGTEILVEFIYKLEKKELIDQMKERTLQEIKKYDERRKKGIENSFEKKENKNKK